MKKVKITVLKTTLDEELAAEYGAEGLGPCPMLREGQVFYADYAKPEGCATRRGRPSTSTPSPWPTGRERVCSITATGSAGPAWPSAPATMGSAP